MREIALDTETTGLTPHSDIPEKRHRIVEIGCVELINAVPTGKTFQAYINPERSMPQEAFSIHGLSESFLKDHPPFHQVVEGFLSFIGSDPLVIHNAPFDMKFLNAELVGAGYKVLSNTVVDTLIMARTQFPGSPASLDKLCKRFKISTAQRAKHGALLDAELLSCVYLELRGGKQTAFDFSDNPLSRTENRNLPGVDHAKDRPLRPVRAFPLKKEELEAHLELLSRLHKPLWGTGR